MHCGFLQVCRLLHCLHGQRWKRHEMCAKALALKSPLPVLHGERVRARGSSRHRRCIRVPPHNKGERTAANSPPPCGEGLGVGVRRQALCVGTTATPSAAPDDCLHALPANFANSPPGPPPHPQTPPREGEGRRIVRRAAASSLWERGNELQFQRKRDAIHTRHHERRSLRHPFTRLSAKRRHSALTQSYGFRKLLRACYQ